MSIHNIPVSSAQKEPTSTNYGSRLSTLIGDFKMNRKYYLAYNVYGTESSSGFGNTWSVLVFNSKSTRAEFIEQQPAMATLIIKRTDATRYATNYNLTLNRDIKPRPFSGEYWAIDETVNMLEDIPGYVGNIVVADPGDQLPKFYA